MNTSLLQIYSLHMNQSNKYCVICGFIKKGELIYKILEDLSIWDKNLTYIKDRYICESCLAEFVLDTEKYVDTKPFFRFNFTK